MKLSRVPIQYRIIFLILLFLFFLSLKGTVSYGESVNSVTPTNYSEEVRKIEQDQMLDQEKPSNEQLENTSQSADDVDFGYFASPSLGGLRPGIGLGGGLYIDMWNGGLRMGF